LVLEQSGLKLRGTEDVVHLGEEINAQYIQRSDLPISLMRILNPSVPIPTIIEAVVVTTANSEDGSRVLDCTETITNQ
jgi:hypothetical protein